MNAKDWFDEERCELAEAKKARQLMLSNPNEDNMEEYMEIQMSNTSEEEKVIEKQIIGEDEVIICRPTKEKRAGKDCSPDFKIKIYLESILLTY